MPVAKCCICLESLWKQKSKDKIRLPCSHEFCKTCILNWISTSLKLNARNSNNDGSISDSDSSDSFTCPTCRNVTLISQIFSLAQPDLYFDCTICGKKGNSKRNSNNPYKPLKLECRHEFHLYCVYDLLKYRYRKIALYDKLLKCTRYLTNRDSMIKFKKSCVDKFSCPICASSISTKFYRDKILERVDVLYR